MAHAGGAPLKYTIDDLNKGINDFWAYIEANQVAPTLERLYDILDWDNETLKDYENRSEFSATIKRVRRKILASKVEKLNDTRNPAGIIFDLKNNYHYTDKTEQTIELSGVNGQPLATMTDDQVKSNLEALGYVKKSD